jgi:hypothetical protein
MEIFRYLEFLKVMKGLIFLYKKEFQDAVFILNFIYTILCKICLNILNLLDSSYQFMTVVFAHHSGIWKQQ